MSETIPDDVREAARELAREVVKMYRGGKWLNEAAEPIARAIMDARLAERKRCAEVASRDGSSHSAMYPHTALWLHDTRIMTETADRIATAILGNGEGAER